MKAGPIEGEAPVFTAAAAEAFRAVTSDAKYFELLNLFLETLDRLPARLQRLQRAGDVGGIGQEAHKLIMSSGTFGARQVLDRAQGLQNACKRAEAGVALGLASGLAAAAVAASAAMRAHYGLVAHGAGASDKHGISS